MTLGLVADNAERLGDTEYAGELRAGADRAVANTAVEALMGYGVGKAFTSWGKLGHASPSPTTVGKAGVRATKRSLLEEVDGFVKISDEAGNSAGRGWLGDAGELNLVIDVRNAELSGRQVFDDIYSFINKNYDEVTSVRGTWRQGPLDSNLNSYIANRAGGMDKAQAAMGTFTGKMSGSKGFNQASVSETLNSAGDIIGVDVIFKQ
jgi:hypothetical protein